MGIEIDELYYTLAIRDEELEAGLARGQAKLRQFDAAVQETAVGTATLKAAAENAARAADLIGGAWESVGQQVTDSLRDMAEGAIAELPPVARRVAIELIQHLKRELDDRIEDASRALSVGLINTDEFAEQAQAAGEAVKQKLSAQLEQLQARVEADVSITVEADAETRAAEEKIEGLADLAPLVRIEADTQALEQVEAQIEALPREVHISLDTAALSTLPASAAALTAALTGASAAVAIKLGIDASELDADEVARHAQEIADAAGAEIRFAPDVTPLDALGDLAAEAANEASADITIGVDADAFTRAVQDVVQQALSEIDPQIVLRLDPSSLDDSSLTLEVGADTTSAQRELDELRARAARAAEESAAVEVKVAIDTSDLDRAAETVPNAMQEMASSARRTERDVRLGIQALEDEFERMEMLAREQRSLKIIDEQAWKRQGEEAAQAFRDGLAQLQVRAAGLEDLELFFELDEKAKIEGFRAGESWLDEFTRAHDQKVADARLALLDGLIDPTEFRAWATEAAEELNAALRQEMQAIEARGELTEPLYAAIVGQMKQIGADGGKALVAGLRSEFDASIVQAQEDFTRGLIDESTLRRRGREAGEALRTSILAEIEKLRREDRLTPEIHAKLVQELGAAGADAGEKLAAGVTKGAGDARKSLNNFSGWIRGTFAVVAIAALASVGRAINGVLQSIARGIDDVSTRAGRITDISFGFKQQSVSNGINPREALAEMRQATEGMVSRFDLMRRANALLNTELPITAKNMGEIAVFSRRLGEAVGVDATQSYEGFVRALATGESAFLKQLGLTTTMESAVRAWARENGKVGRSLSENERRLIFYNAAMAEAAQKTKELGEENEHAGRKVARLKTFIEDFKDAASLAIVESPRLAGLIDSLGSSADDAGARVEDLALKVGAATDVIVEQVAALIGWSRAAAPFLRNVPIVGPAIQAAEAPFNVADQVTGTTTFQEALARREADRDRAADLDAIRAETDRNVLLQRRMDILREISAIRRSGIVQQERINELIEEEQLTRQRLKQLDTPKPPPQAPEGDVANAREREAAIKRLNERIREFQTTVAAGLPTFQPIPADLPAMLQQVLALEREILQVEDEIAKARGGAPDGVREMLEAMQRQREVLQETIRFSVDARPVAEALRTLSSETEQIRVGAELDGPRLQAAIAAVHEAMERNPALIDLRAPSVRPLIEQLEAAVAGADPSIDVRAVLEDLAPLLSDAQRELDASPLVLKARLEEFVTELNSALVAVQQELLQAVPFGAELLRAPLDAAMAAALQLTQAEEALAAARTSTDPRERIVAEQQLEQARRAVTEASRALIDDVRRLGWEELIPADQVQTSIDRIEAILREGAGNAADAFARLRESLMLPVDGGSLPLGIALDQLGEMTARVTAAERELARAQLERDPLAIARANAALTQTRAELADATGRIAAAVREANPENAAWLRITEKLDGVLQAASVSIDTLSDATLRMSVRFQGGTATVGTLIERMQDLSQQAIEAREEFQRLSQSEDTTPEQMRRARREMEELRRSAERTAKAIAAALRQAARAGTIDPGEAEAAIGSIEQSVAGLGIELDRAADSGARLVQTLSTVEGLARGVLSVADAMGVLDDKTRRTLQGTIDLVSGIGRIASGDVIGGVAQGIGGAIGVIAGLTGPSEADKQRAELLKRNNEALEKLRLALEGFRVTQTKLDAAFRAVKALDALEGLPRMEIFGVNLRNAPEEANKFLAPFGLTVAQLQEIAREQGFDILTDRGGLVLDEFLKALELAIGGLTGFRESLGDRRQEIELETNIFNEPTDAATKLRREFDLLTKFMPKFAKELEGLDLSVEADRDRFEELFQRLFRDFQAGTLDIENLTRDEFVSLIGSIADALDEAREEAGGGASTPFQITRSMSEVTGNRIVGYLATSVYWDEQQTRILAELLRAFTGQETDLPAAPAFPREAPEAGDLTGGADRLIAAIGAMHEADRAVAIQLTERIIAALRSLPDPGEPKTRRELLGGATPSAAAPSLALDRAPLPVQDVRLEATLEAGSVDRLIAALDALARAVDSTTLTVSPAPPVDVRVPEIGIRAPDLSIDVPPLAIDSSSQLAALEAALRAVELPDPAPLVQATDALRQVLQATEPLDTGPLLRSLEGLRTAVEAERPPDFGPVIRAVEDLRTELLALHRLEPFAVDAPVLEVQPTPPVEISVELEPLAEPLPVERTPLAVDELAIEDVDLLRDALLRAAAANPEAALVEMSEALRLLTDAVEHVEPATELAPAVERISAGTVSPDEDVRAVAIPRELLDTLQRIHRQTAEIVAFMAAAAQIKIEPLRPPSRQEFERFVSGPELRMVQPSVTLPSISVSIHSPEPIEPRTAELTGQRIGRAIGSGIRSELRQIDEGLGERGVDRYRAAGRPTAFTK